jgi:hypothetical protein
MIRSYSQKIPRLNQTTLNFKLTLHSFKYILKTLQTLLLNLYSFKKKNCLVLKMTDFNGHNPIN